MSLKESFKKLYFQVAGYSYPNMGRLFMRLFVGIMLLQFGIRQIADFANQAPVFPSMLGMGHEASCVVMIVIEIGCSLFVMAGFLTRLMLVPPFVAMCCAEYYLLNSVEHSAPYLLQWNQTGYLPVMFMGIFFFLMLVGPGKISVDYFLSLHIIHTDNKSETELEEV